MFYCAGLGPTSNLLTFAAYELTLNQDIQGRLIREVDELTLKLNGEIVTYEQLSDLKYLDMIISETLRKWPASIYTDRNCTKSYALEVDDMMQQHRLRPGDGICIPIFGLHRDSEHFPDPERFDPERFNDANRASITPGTYLPFGIGPRHCLGDRFAAMTAKAILYTLLTAFTFEVSPTKTKIPIPLQINGFMMQPKDIWLRLKPRN